MFKLAVVVAPLRAKFEAVASVEALEEAARKAHEHGFEGLEISLLDPSSVDRASIRSTLSKYGLEVPALSTGLNFLHYGLSLSSPDPSVRSAALERLKRFVDLGSYLGAGVVVGLMRGRTEGRISREEALRLVVEGLRELCAYAEGKGVRVFFEPLNRYETDLVNTVEEALRVLREVSSPSLRLLLDTFHMNIEEPRIEDSIKRASGLIGHFHVADSNRLAPGMGHLDFASILSALREAGYSGYLSAEVVIKPSLDAVLKTTARTLRPLISAMGE